MARPGIEGGPTTKQEVRDRGDDSDRQPTPPTKPKPPSIEGGQTTPTKPTPSPQQTVTNYEKCEIPP